MGDAGRRVPGGTTGHSAGVQSWDELIDTLRTDGEAAARLDGIELPRSNLALLDQHLGLLGLIRVVPGPRGTGHNVTVAVCDACGQRMLCSAAVPRRCRAAQVPAHHRWSARR